MMLPRVITSRQLVAKLQADYGDHGGNNRLAQVLGCSIGHSNKIRTGRLKDLSDAAAAYAVCQGPVARRLDSY